MAWAFLRYSDVYAPNEASARASSIGVWTGRYPTPWEFRENRWSAAAANAPRGCPIKGNISQNGRIYHTPWSPWYSRTRINAVRGERWFCTEAEAIAAGWRAPYGTNSNLDRMALSDMPSSQVGPVAQLVRAERS